MTQNPEIFDEFLDPVLLLNEKCEAVYGNGVFEEIFGTLEENKPCVLCSRLKPPTECLSKTVRARKHAFVLREVSLAGKNGVPRSILLQASPWGSKPGSPEGTLVLLRDMSEEADVHKNYKELYQKEKEARFELIQAEKLSTIGQMSGGIIHELNNPLTGLWGLVNTVLKKTLPEDERAPFLRSMQDAIEQCLKVVSTLQDFVRPAQESMGTLSCNTLLTNTLGFSAYQLERSGVEIVRQFSDNLRPVLGNKNRLQQVFLNMIINARDAMPQGGRLTISTKNGPAGTVRVVFEDTGTGIEESLLEKIFEPFFTTKERGKGTGLGLAICQNIVNNLSGKITVVSKKNLGTTFTIELPSCP